VGRFLGWLIDEELQDLRPLPDCIAPETVRSYCAWLGDRVAPATVHGQIRDLVEFFRVAWPNLDRNALRRAEQSLRWRRVPSKDKRSRLQPIPELVKLGNALMANANSMAGKDPRLPLTQFRDGLAIAFLALRPLRIRAFGSLQLSVHLVQSGDGWKIIIPPDLSKTHRHWEADFPVSLLPALDQYLNQVRPQLLRLRGRWHSDPGRALWISNDGSALKPKALAEATTKRTGTAFGRPISPHFFRDCAATTLAQDSPENVRLATPMLGHTHPKMTEKHYNQACQLQAGRKHIDVMAKMRRSLR
jgi:integrase